jgi:hypothetical protein
MSTSPLRLETAIKDHLAPALREDRFTGSGRNFRRILNDLIQVVNVQGSRDGGKFAINLAVQPLFIPDSLGNMPNPKKILEPECEFRRRLSDFGADHWWSYENYSQSMNAAVISATEMYKEIGRQLLAGISKDPSPIYTVSPSDFINGKYNFYGFGNTEVRLSLVLSRLRKWQGNLIEAREFAAFGLSKASNAVALRQELEALSKIS